jgi:hypothetical protein
MILDYPTQTHGHEFIDEIGPENRRIGRRAGLILQ